MSVRSSARVEQRAGFLYFSTDEITQVRMLSI